MPHIVDTLIEERATKLMQRPRVWRLVQRHLYPVLGYRDAVDLIDHVQDMTGHEIFDHMSERLDLEVRTTGLEHIPREGAAIVMPNHPAGIADGIAVYDAIREIRPDVCFFANRDAVRCAPSLSDLIIPVEWMTDKRTHAKSKETVRNMVRAFKDERLVVIFASGRLARPTPIGLFERPWLTSGVSLAQKYDCPIVPMHITGHNSALYYLLWFVNNELKDMTLFRELLNKAGQRYVIRAGEPVRVEHDVDALTVALRQFVTRDLKRGATRFDPAGL
jgi:putative hemolysin